MILIINICYIYNIYLLLLYYNIMEALILSGLAFSGYHIIKNSNDNNDNNDYNYNNEKFEKKENIKSIFNNINSQDKEKIIENLSEIMHNKSKVLNGNVISRNGIFKLNNKQSIINKNEKEHSEYLNSLTKFNSLLPETLKKEESKYLDKYFAKIGYEKNCNKNFSENSQCNDESWENMFGNLQIKEHNNMIPFFGSHIKQNIDHNEHNSQKLNNYSTKVRYKREQLNFSDAFKNKQYIAGMKNNNSEVNYYINSNLKQGEKPFQEIKVGPGLNISSEDVHSKRGFHEIYRHKEKNVDEIRTKNNPKISYKGKLNIGKSKIDKSQIKSNMMKNKPEKFRELHFGDLLRTTGSYLKEAFYGKFEEKPKKHQSIKEHYGQIGRLPKSKLRENFKKSFKSENKNTHTGNIKTFNKETNYIVDRPKTTIKETTLHEPPKFLSNNEKKRYAEFEDKAKITVKETIEVNKHYGNIGSYDGQISKYTDKMKTTLKESTENEDHNGFINAYEKQINQYTDNAKGTLKETTEINNHMGNLKNYVKNIINYIDNAKNTIKQTTEQNEHTGNIQTYIKETMKYIDNAKNTLKQTTEQNQHNGYILNVIKPAMQYIDDAKHTIKETIENNYHMGNVNTNEKITSQFTDHAKTTIKELSENNKYTGNIDTYNKSINTYTDKLITTIKETTENNDYNGNIFAFEKPTNQLNDDMKTTLKETTVEYTRDGAIGTIKKNIKQLDDKMKTTLKETTVGYTRDGTIKGNNKQQNQLFDDAKTTLKEITEYNIYNSSVKGLNKSKEYQKDEAKYTKKQDTSNNEYIAIAYGLNKETNQDNFRNATTNDLKEIISKRRENNYQGPKTNTSSNMININVNTQQLKNLPVNTGISTTNKKLNFEINESNKNIYSNNCRLDTRILDSLKMNPLNLKKIYDNRDNCK